MSGPYAKGAKAYRGLGLGQAIPVTYGGEINEATGEPEGPRPARKKLIGHGAQTSGDLDRALEKLFRRRYGDLNLGLHLDEGVISLDVDTIAPLREWLRDRGYTLPATPFSTARGPKSERRQLLYRVEGPWRSNGLLPAGGEIIDADHRYVRAWPSVHKSGARYEWYEPKREDAFGPGVRRAGVPARHDLALLPMEIAQAMTQAASENTRARGERVDDVEAFIAELPDGEPDAALRRLARAVPTEGADNNGLMDLFGPLVRAAWSAQGGRAAVEEGISRYSDGYGREAYTEALQAVGRAAGDYRAELERRTMAITFPMDLPRTDARPTERATPREKKSKAKAKKAKSPAPSREDRERDLLHDRAYQEAKLDAATDDVLRAEYAARELADRIVFASGKQAYQWNGIRWVEVADAYAREVVRGWHVELAAALMHVSPKQTFKVLTAGSVENTLKLLRGLLARDTAAFDSHPDLLNCPNGIVDLRTGELLPHDPAMLMTKVTRAKYVAGATHRDWDRALEALPESSRTWLGRKFGQGITGHMSDDDVMPICQGGGENAKSTLFTAITRSVGDYAVQVPESLLQGERGAIPLDKMTLRGARIAIAEEASDDRRLNAKQIKDVLGTPSITARALYSPFVTFPATHSLFVSTNYRLSVTETDWGTWRRLKLVIFPYRFVQEQLDPDEETHGPIRIADPLKNERPGDRRLRPAMEKGKGGRAEAVLAWLVANAQAWYADGRVTPPAPRLIEEDTVVWRSEQDAVQRFADERLVFGAEHFTSTNDLYQAFVTWLAQNGHPKWGIELFSARFGSHDRIKGLNVAPARRKIGDRQVRGWDLVGLRPLSMDIAKPLS